MLNGILLFGVKYYYYNYSSFSLSYSENILNMENILICLCISNLHNSKKKLINESELIIKICV